MGRERVEGHPGVGGGPWTTSDYRLRQLLIAPLAQL